MKNEYGKMLIAEEEYNSLLSELKRWRVVEELADVIWEVDMNLKFRYISPAVEDLLGYTQEEMMDITMNHLFTPESVTLIENTLAEGIAEHTTESPRVIPPPIEVEAVHCDGTSVWLELSRVFVRDEDNNAVGVIGVARNITYRIDAARALQESEAKYRAVSEKSVLGIAIAQDDPVRLSYVNNTLANLLGYDKGEMTKWRGDETARVINPEDRERFFRTFRERLENIREPAPYKFRGVRKSGETIWLEVHGTRIEYLNNV
ncbi:MAG: PAS domain-containing protein, partial [Candidatus Thorarchaeota archaeon]